MGESRLAFARDSIKFKGFKADVLYGKNVQIGIGTVIGEDGFGWERDEHGTPVKIFHAGGVILHDNVWIGVNCVISRATSPGLYTVVCGDCKIDDLCHIAHNCIIGPRTMIASGTVVGGSVTIGSDCWIGSSATIKNKIHIASNTLIGVGSVVVKDIEESGGVWAGNPAQFMRMKREGE